MSDQGPQGGEEPPRPSWPGAKPAWGEPTPPASPTPPTPAPPPSPTPPPAADQPPAAADGPAGGAPPSWPTATPPERRRRFADVTFDIKIVIAVLIGLASVTGAVITWRASILGEYATDRDRQAIAEAVLVQQNLADDEVAVQDARLRFAEHAVAQVAANQLLLQVDQFVGAGNGAAADNANEEAVEQQAIADRVLEGGPQRLSLVPYISTGDDGVPVFDESGFRDDLTALREAESQVQPVQTVRESNRLRSESQRLVGWLIGVVAAVALLTLAQMSRTKPLRFGLATLGTSLWIICAVLAYGSQ